MLYRPHLVWDKGRKKKKRDDDDFAKYTLFFQGYDMEDAMIINKSSYERGFAAGSVYKSELVELTNTTSFFQRDPNMPDLATYLDSEGLPPVGARIMHDNPIAW
jgi:DNA-directed RNA polymerase beta subunit